MRRKIYDKLLAWKKGANRECALLIDGARRVGKSFIVEEFAKNEYDAYLLINFQHVGRDVKETFEEYLGNLDVFFRRLFQLSDVKPLPKGRSLIIFDEVQAFPRAREAIKRLVEDGRYDYVETGSLVSIRKNTEGILLPSEERHLKMYPMDFEEFLWADGNDGLMDLVRESFSRREPMRTLHRRAMDEFRAYLVVGGMPQAVKKYVATHDFNEVDLIKRDILELYRGGIVKHAGAQSLKVESVWDRIPAQLSRHEKKFCLSDIAPGARYREYEEPVFWLKDSMTVNLCYNATEPNVGLSLSADHASFKCYMADTGLLISHAFDENALAANEIHRRLLFGDIDINEGMLTENVVAQMLTASGRKLYFYSRSDSASRENRMEIDFLLSKTKLAERRNIHPVEVKSGKRSRLRSLRKYQAKFGDWLDEPFVLHSRDLKAEDGMTYLPLYMTPLL